MIAPIGICFQATDAISRVIRLGPLLLLLGCAVTPEAAAPSFESADPTVRTQAIGQLVRAGQACNLMLSVTTLDRAARIEAAVIEERERSGGTAARDAFLRSMAPPEFGAAGFDHRRWCAMQRAEVERMNTYLAGPAGAALLQQAEVKRAISR